MDKENNKLKNISYIAAGCVFAAVLLSLLNLVNKDYSLYGNYFEWIGSSHNYENYLERYRPLFQLVAYTMIACSVMLKKKTLLIGSLAAIPVIMIISDLEHFFSLLQYNFLLYSAYIFIVIIVVFSQSNTELAKKMFFIPAILLFADVAYGLFRAFVDSKQTFATLNKLFYGSELFIVIAFFFIGLWTVTYIEPKKLNSSEKSLVNKSSDADRLLKLKELLDSGAITQAEYESKKKQILKL